MTSKELHSEILRNVTDRLDLDVYKKEGEASVRNCPECRKEYEEELKRKMVVRKRSDGEQRATTTPEALERSLDAIEKAENRRRASYSRRSRRSAAGVPLFILLALILALGAYIILFDDKPDSETSAVSTASSTAGQGAGEIPQPTRRSTGPANLFNQAMANYQNLMEEKLEVEYKASDLSSLSTTFAGQGIPSLTFTGASLPLQGGVVSKHGESSLPHLIYREGETRLYVTEVPVSVLKEEKGVYVTQDVLAQLEAGEKIWMEAPMRGHLVMYKEGDAVIVAVANRSSLDMKKLLGFS